MMSISCCSAEMKQNVAHFDDGRKGMVDYSMKIHNELCVDCYVPGVVVIESCDSSWNVF